MIGVPARFSVRRQTDLPSMMQLVPAIQLRLSLLNYLADRKPLCHIAHIM